MRLSDLISPTMPAGAALFLEWNGYHVFSIPRREILHTGIDPGSNLPRHVRFSGVGGKRSNPEEAFADCAMRESEEEIGAVVSKLESAEQAYYFDADETIEAIDIADERIRPRLILEKREHSGHGSMKKSDKAYYLVAFNASLSGKPRPGSEIAALLYLKTEHLLMMTPNTQLTVAEVMRSGAEIEYQARLTLADSVILVPHGTALFLVRQQLR